MEFERNTLILMLISLCSAQSPFYLPPPSLSYPERVPELGLTPRYNALVYQYIAKMAGNQQPSQVAVVPAQYEDFGVSGPVLPDIGSKEPVTEGPTVAGAPLQPSHLLPSDFVLLANSPQSQFFGHFDGVKNKKVTQGVNQYALPPIGGVLSNYILQRGLNDNKVKRQTFAYSHDGTEEEVVINAAQRVEESSSASSSDNSNKNTTSSTTDEKEEPQPAVAQSKPAAVALAGAGGVAQAAPVATAVVGKDGLAIAAPSATAIAGRGASTIQLGGEEKVQRRASVTAESVKKNLSEK